MDDLNQKPEWQEDVLSGWTGDEEEIQEAQDELVREWEGGRE